MGAFVNLEIVSRENNNSLGIAEDSGGLVAACEPEHIGVEKQKEDKADGEEVHIEAKKNPGVEEVPMGASHAAKRIAAADDSDNCRNDNEWICAVVGKAGEEIGNSEACKHECAASQDGCFMRIEDAGFHTIDRISTGKDRPFCVHYAASDGKGRVDCSRCAAVNSTQIQAGVS